MPPIELDPETGYPKHQIHINPYHCPSCQRHGRFRSGVGFEHEMRCSSCNLVWDPERVIQERRDLAANQIGQYGDGI